MAQDYTDARQFNTIEVRPWTKPRLDNAMIKYFVGQYSTAPRVPFGLSFLDIDCGHNIRITGKAEDIMTDKFTASLNAWADTVLYAAGLTFIELGPGYEFLQTGTFNTQEVGRWQDHAQKNSKRITFAQPFERLPPKIICWLTDLDFDNQHNFRCKTYATDIDTNGFTVHIDTWADSIMYMAGMTWLAYPATQPNVQSGWFGIDNSEHKLDNTGVVAFDTPFYKVPKLAMALNGLDFDCHKNLRVRLDKTAVTPTSMTWLLQSWADSTMYWAQGVYFAWA